MYKLRDWVDETQLTRGVSINERAVEYLETHEHLIDDDYIFLNENAIHIIEKKIQYDKNGWVNCYKSCEYEHGIEFVDEFIKNNELDKINWYILSVNPAAMHILNDPKYYEYIDWCGIVCNKNAAELVKNNLHMVVQYWTRICRQPHLMDIIEQYMERINWAVLSENYNAIHILEKNLDKISVFGLCGNKNGFHLLLKLNHIFDDDLIYDKHIVLDYFDYCEKNNIKFNLIRYLSKYGYTEKHMKILQYNNYYPYLSANPNIFEYDYKRMRETRQSLLWYNDIKK